MITTWTLPPVMGEGGVLSVRFPLLVGLFHGFLCALRTRPTNGCGPGHPPRQGRWNLPEVALVILDLALLQIVEVFLFEYALAMVFLLLPNIVSHVVSHRCTDSERAIT